MKSTNKILSVFIATQIAFNCFASAVESAKGTTAPAKTTKSEAKAASKSTKKTVKSKTTNSATKKTNKTGPKAKLATSGKSTGEKIVLGKPSTADKTKATTVATPTATEPKEAVETEIETIDQMEAAIAADQKKSSAVAMVAPSATTGTAIAPATTTTTSAASTAAAAETKLTSYNMSLYGTYNTAAEAPEKGDRNQYMTYDLIPAMTIGPVKTLAWFQYNQNLVDNAKSEWQDFPVLVTLAKPYQAGEYLTLSPAASVTVPQTKSSKDVAQLNYIWNVNVTLGLNSKNVGLDGMLLQWQTGYTRMNTEFTTNNAGEPITSYRFRQRINFWYPIVDALTFKSRFQVDSNFSYENVVRNNFSHFVALEYRIKGTYFVNAGHGNGGPVFSGANYENNLKFYSGTSSEYFLGVGADY